MSSTTLHRTWAAASSRTRRILASIVLVSATASAQFASEDTRLISNPPHDQAYFGRSVSVSGDVLVVGAPGEISQGTAYVWRRIQGNWTVEAALNGADESSQAN